MQHRFDNGEIVDFIVLPHSTIALRSDGIIELNTKIDFYYTLKETIEGIKAIGKLSGGKLVRVLKIAGNGSSVDAESRKYIASGIGSRFSIAEAILIETFAHKLIGNFYLKVERPIKPTKLFNDKDKAVEWLLNFVS